MENGLQVAVALLNCVSSTIVAPYHSFRFFSHLLPFSIASHPPSILSQHKGMCYRGDMRIVYRLIH